jgi:hypothetical protein
MEHGLIKYPSLNATFMLYAGLMDRATITMFSPATAFRALSPETTMNGNLSSGQAAVFGRPRYDAATETGPPPTGL